MKGNLSAYSSVRRFFYDYRTENFQPVKGTCGILHNNSDPAACNGTPHVKALTEASWQAGDAMI